MMEASYLEGPPLYGTWQIANFMGPTWGPPGSWRPQMGPCWPHELFYLGWHRRQYIMLTSSCVTPFTRMDDISSSGGRGAVVIPCPVVGEPGVRLGVAWRQWCSCCAHVVRGRRTDSCFHVPWARWSIWGYMCLVFCCINSISCLSLTCGGRHNCSFSINRRWRHCCFYSACGGCYFIRSSCMIYSRRTYCRSFGISNYFICSGSLNRGNCSFLCCSCGHCIFPSWSVRCGNRLFPSWGLRCGNWLFPSWGLRCGNWLFPSWGLRCCNWLFPSWGLRCGNWLFSSWGLRCGNWLFPSWGLRCGNWLFPSWGLRCGNWLFPSWGLRCGNRLFPSWGLRCGNWLFPSWGLRCGNWHFPSWGLICGNWLCQSWGLKCGNWHFPSWGLICGNWLCQSWGLKCGNLLCES